MTVCLWLLVTVTDLLLCLFELAVVLLLLCVDILILLDDIAWCVDIYTSDWLMSPCLDKNKALWSTEINISLCLMSLCPSNNKYIQFLDDPSWSCHVEYFLSMHFCVELSLVLLFTVTLLYFSFVIHNCILWTLCCFWHYVFSPLFPNCSNVHVHLVIKIVYELIKFIICLWSVGFGDLLPEVIFCWYLDDPHMSLCPDDTLFYFLASCEMFISVDHKDFIFYQDMVTIINQMCRYQHIKQSH